MASNAWKREEGPRSSPRPSSLSADEDKTPEELLKEENERLSDTAERLATLTIPMLVDRSADEKTDLAKAEWLKVYGVIFGCEDQANELFQQMVKAEENK